MAKDQLDIIKDILEWPMSDKDKLSFISGILGVAPKAAAPPAAVPAAPKKAAKKAPTKTAKKAAKKGGRKGPRTTRKTELWNEVKAKAPEKLRSLTYREAKTEDLEKILAQI